MPTFVYSMESPPSTMGFGVTAPTVKNDIKGWIPSKSIPVKEKAKEEPNSKQSRLWYERSNPLVHKSELKSYNTRVLASRRDR